METRTYLTLRTPFFLVLALYFSRLRVNRDLALKGTAHHAFRGLLLQLFPPRQGSDEDNHLPGVRRGCELTANIRSSDALLNYLLRREFHRGQPRVIRRVWLAHRVTSNDPNSVGILHDRMDYSKVAATVRLTLSIHFCIFVSKIKPSDTVFVRRNRHRVLSFSTYPCIHTSVGYWPSVLAIHKFDLNRLCAKNRAG
jgi:hypothetical protein